ncbi:MAG TPA: N-acetyltransferase [Candidatus Eisenbacteria bacterium]|nr:N-acetyltransferase [Candidatus Eisenbacteria bacterium]
MTPVEVLIREETPEDIPAIHEVNEAAFGRPDEALLVDRLRANGAVLLSLVAIAGERVVGHILYSPVTLGERDAPLDGAGLGPMAVLPEDQRGGIGGRLVAEGTRRMRERGCPFIVVLGHPEYYPRFGFVPASRHGVRCQWEVPDEVFMILLLEPGRLGARTGPVRYRDEFSMVS